MRGLEKNRMGRGQIPNRFQTDIRRTSRLLDRISPVGRFDDFFCHFLVPFDVTFAVPSDVTFEVSFDDAFDVTVTFVTFDDNCQLSSVSWTR